MSGKQWSAVFFSGLLFLSICACGPESRTVRLPEPEQPEQRKTEESSGYTVEKMYVQEFSTFLGMESAAFLQNTEEHRVRILTAGEEWEADSISMDYRYGFFEEEYKVPGDRMMYVWEWWNIENGSLDAGVQRFLSPDGRYLLFPMLIYSYTGSQLYYMDLKTGEELLILDGDELGYTGDEYFIMAAWSQDASLLCYGFFPSDTDVWVRDWKEGRGYQLHFWDLERKAEAGVLNYQIPAFGEERPEKAWNLKGTSLYVNRAEEQLQVVFLRENFAMNKNGTYGLGQGVDIFSYTLWQDEEISGETQTGDVLPMAETGIIEPSFSLEGPFVKILPDAAAGRCYILSELEGLLLFNVETRVFEELIGIGNEEYETVVTDFLVLDDGETFLTAERAWGSESQDICIYRKQDKELVREILYMHAGEVLKMEYEEAGRRLLIESGQTAETGAYMWSTERTVLILEFE